MSMRAACMGLAIALTLASQAALAQQAYRWVDDHGNVHYVGRRDQVPEQYRSQLPPAGPGEPARPRLPAARGIGGPVTAECILRVRSTERRAGSSRSFPDCEACWRTLRAMKGDDRARAECVATSVESYR